MRSSRVSTVIPSFKAGCNRHNRNLRIDSNIVRLVRTPEERILVLIGAGHVPIIHHAMESSPAVRLIEVRDILR